MKKGTINWKLIIVLVIGFLVLAVTAVALRQFNRSSRVQKGLSQGTQAYEEKNWSEAATNLGKYLAVNQDDTEILLKYAQAQLNIRPPKETNLNQAISAYRQILRNDKTFTEAAEKLIEIYLQINQAGEAELIANDILKSAPDHYRIRHLLAISLIQKREFQRAYEELERVIATDSSQIEAYDTIARLSENQPGKFIVTPDQWYETAITNNPDNAHAYLIRASFLLRNGQLDAALKDLKQAEQHDLSDTKVRLAIAREYLNAGQHDQCRTHLKAILDTEPDNLSLWQIWANLAFKSNSTEEMAAVADQALSHLSLDKLAFRAIAAELYIRSGVFEKASASLEKLETIEYKPATLAYLEGLMAEQQQLWGEAVQSWRKALSLGYSSETLYISLASALLKLGDNESAIRYLENYVSENGSSYRTRMILAQLFYDTGQYTDATDHARTAYALNPNSESKLLYTKARLGLAQTGQISKNSIIWDNIGKDIKELQEEGMDPLQLKLLQLEMYKQRNDFENANLIIANLKKDYPENTDVALAEINLLILENNPKKLESQLRANKEKFPKTSIFVKYLVGYLSSQKKYDEAINLLEESIQDTSEPLHKKGYISLLAQIHARMNNVGKSYELLASTIKDYPQDIKLRQQLLNYSYGSEKTDSAQDIIDEIKSIEGNEGRIWKYEQARFWFLQPDVKARSSQIISMLKDNLISNPGDQPSMRLLGAIYEKTGQLQLAVSTYKEALARSPEDINLIIPTVAALYKINEYEQAQQILSKVSSQQLSDPRLMGFQYQYFLQEGQLESASELLQKSITEDPGNKQALLALAQLKIQQNNPTDAKQLLRQVLNMDPESLAAAAMLSELLTFEGKNDQAIELANNLIGRLNSAQAYILRSQVYLRTNQVDKAVEDIELAIKREPDRIQSYLVKIDLYRTKGDLETTIKTAREILDKYPDEFSVVKKVALNFLASGNNETIQEGSRLLDKAIEMNPDDADIAILKAEWLIDEKLKPSQERAIQLLKNVTLKNPKIARAWALLAQIYLERDDLAHAIDLLIQGLSYLPNNRDLMLIKAICESRRSPQLAISTLKPLYEENPADVEIAIHLANNYSDAGEYEQALKIYNECKKNVKPEQFNSIRMIHASNLYKQGKKEESEALFMEIYNETPADITPLMAYARVLLNDKQFNLLKEKIPQWYEANKSSYSHFIQFAGLIADQKQNEAFDAAKAILSRILQDYPDDTNALNSQAVLYHTSGELDKAVKMYRKILKINPNQFVAANNLAWILCNNLNNCQEALELANTTLSNAPTYVDLIDTRGYIRMKLGMYESARDDFIKCVELYPTESPQLTLTYYHLGKAYMELGDPVQAQKHLEKAKETHKNSNGLSSSDINDINNILKDLKH